MRGSSAAIAGPAGSMGVCGVSGNEVGLSYATALIDSLESAADIQHAARDLETFRDLMAKLPALGRVLQYPGFTIEKRTKILGEVLAKTNPHPVARRFLNVVLSKERIGDLGAMIDAFHRLADARQKIASAEVVSAVPLDKAARASMEKTLAARTGGEVRVTYRTDAALLGGVQTRIGSTVYDGSLRKQLERIRGVLLHET